MTPAEQAKELVNKFKDHVAINYQYDEEPIFECQKECALIVVNEILKANPHSINPKFDIHVMQDPRNQYWRSDDYWEEVKREIEKL